MIPSAFMLGMGDEFSWFRGEAAACCFEPCDVRRVTLPALCLGGIPYKANVTERIARFVDQDLYKDGIGQAARGGGRAPA